jgi:hypothetical protein
MKYQLINLISGVSLSILSAYSSFAQQGTFRELPPVTISAATSGNAISTKVVRMFIQYFKNASNLRWYEHGKNFLVKFTMNEQENRALFTGSGQLVYQVSYGTETHLPAGVRKLIKSNYYDQKITKVLKVNQDLRAIWVVYMEDDKDLIWARVEDGELEETQRIEKSK